MNKRTQIILFAAVVSLGIFLIDSFLFGQLPGEDEECYCYDSEAVWLECYAVCLGHGGCDVPWLHHPGKCETFAMCETKVTNWCKTPPITSFEGWHYDFDCGDCYIIL